ncbi:hypothetical protein ACHAXA_001625 [Cyclostephanos tholiformis]|uniref:Uncharacterized protein n=1 Tax=Cyclostephanos tholiformis TaxID=382380 RepID=A0ABD3RE45_9STRA
MECRELESGLSCVLKSVDRVRWEVTNRDGDAIDNGRLLTSIQTQVWMRMMAWTLERDAGWELLGRAIAISDDKWRKGAGAVAGGTMAEAAAAMAAGNIKKRGRKSMKNEKTTVKGRNTKERKSARDGLVEDVKLLTELAPYVLPVSLDFSNWLRQILTFGYRQRIPDYGPELFDHFEIDVDEPTALGRTETDPSRPPEESETTISTVVVNCTRGDTSKLNGESPAKRLTAGRHDRQRAYFASLVEGEKFSSSKSNAAVDENVANAGSLSKSSARGKDDTLLFKTPVSLTAAARARTSNPFLKGSARGSYVGSHLGSKLSNITSLFREVKTPAIAKLNPAKAQVAKRKGKNFPPINGSATCITSSATRAKEKPNAAGDAESLSSFFFSLNETPLKKRRPSFAPSRTTAASMFDVAETPSGPPVIEETPAKRQTSTARLCLDLSDDHPHAGNSIVAETPQHRQPPPRHSLLMPNHPAHGLRRQWAQEKIIEKNCSTEHLSPIVNQISVGATVELRFGLSPLPNQEDMDKIMAKVARSAARRKRK